MSLQVDIQGASTDPVPDEGDIRGWIAATLTCQTPGREATEVSVRLVDIDEMTNLNQTYRGVDGPTNVLSFPSDLPPELGLPLLGDIVVCSPVVRREAAEESKPLMAHWAHMIVHGTLHLLGYDHIEEDEAAVMEAQESAILADLDYPCPYGDAQLQERAGA